MDTYDWLLFLHVTGAFLVLGGAVMAGIFNFAALQRERPSEIAVLFRLARVAVVAIGAGMGLTLVFGLWLVHNAGYGWGETWIVLALVLWVLSNAHGRHRRRTREADTGARRTTRRRGRRTEPGVDGPLARPGRGSP